MPGDEANNTWDSDKALNPFKPLLLEEILIADKSESQVEDCLELNFRNVDYRTYPTVLMCGVLPTRGHQCCAHVYSDLTNSQTIH